MDYLRILLVEDEAIMTMDIKAHLGCHDLPVVSITSFYDSATVQ